MKAWAELDEGLKDSNIQFVDSLPEKLRLISFGYRSILEKGTTGSTVTSLSATEIERLAELEHERWMAERLRAGWKAKPERDVAAQVSNFLAPWSSLSEEAKDWDRTLVAEIPRILRAGGFEAYRIRVATVVAVTGHRILAELDKVSAGVDLALEEIERTWSMGPLHLVSALAEGADRMAVFATERRDEAKRSTEEQARWSLVVILPLGSDEYQTDFKTDASRVEFRELLERAREVVTLPASASREAAYEAAGLAVLDRAEVLLAIWDGQDAQGQGGTAGIVAEARRRGMPIAWVHAGNRKPDTEEPTSLGEEQGEVTFEQWP
jgi:hypothetical protein